MAIIIDKNSISAKIVSQFFVSTNMRLVRRLLPIGIALVILVLLVKSCSGGSAEEQPETADTRPLVIAESVQTGLRQEFTVTGEVEAIQYAAISSPFSADVEQISVKAGDKVRLGQFLLSLDSDSVDARSRNANLSYTTAAQNLEQSKITARKNVESAQIALDAANATLNSILAQNEARRVQAEERLKAAGVSNTLSVDSAQIALDNVLRTVPNTIETALVAIEQYLVDDPSYPGYRAEYDTHIGVRDPSQKLLTERAVTEARNSLAQITGSYESSVSALRAAEQAAISMLTTLNNSVSSSDYADAELRADINAINGQISSIRSQVNSMQSAKASLDQARQSVGDTSQVLVEAQAAYQATIAELARIESDARSQVQQAQISLESARANASISEIGARSTLASVAGELSQARIEAGKLIINAPFAGTVVDVDVRSGEEVQAGRALVTIEDTSDLKVVTAISPTEAIKIRNGDIVQLENGGRGEVLTVSPGVNPVTRKVEIEIRILEGSYQPGQFVRVSFLTESDTVDERIFLPVSAVHITAAETYVWMLSRSGATITALRHPVSIGTVEGSQVEIREGLFPGQRVITGGSRNIDREGQIVRTNEERDEQDEASNEEVPSAE